jgi:hypothetical protein
VRVLGSLTGGPGGGGGANSVSFDDLSFTVGTASAQRFGATSAGTGGADAAYEAAATPPTTDGLEVVTPADRIRQGGRIQIAGSGFDPGDTGVLVVLYSTEADAEPIVLDDTATADENGEVRWSGTLPDEGTGAHVITLQGSTDAGAEIEILEKKEEAAAPAAPTVTEDVTPIAAAVIPPPAGGMAPWEWWVIAGSLVAIAACTSVLVVRQRLGAPVQKELA